jgi:hypothetical protein
MKGQGMTASFLNLRSDQYALGVPGHVQPPATAADLASDFDPQPAATAHKAILDATDAFEKHLNSIVPEHYSPDGLKAKVYSFANSPWLKAVDSAVNAVTDAADSAASDANDARAAVSGGDFATDAADEIRATRVWARAKGKLDAVQGGGNRRCHRSRPERLPLGAAGAR